MDRQHLTTLAEIRKALRGLRAQIDEHDKRLRVAGIVVPPHTHDGDTLQIDGVNSNGGAFALTTTGIVTFAHPLIIGNIKSGATQIAAGAAENEVWKTAGHVSLPDNTLMIGV